MWPAGTEEVENMLLLDVAPLSLGNLFAYLCIVGHMQAANGAGRYRDGWWHDAETHREEQHHSDQQEPGPHRATTCNTVKEFAKWIQMERIQMGALYDIYGALMDVRISPLQKTTRTMLRLRRSGNRTASLRSGRFKTLNGRGVRR